MHRRLLIDFDGTLVDSSRRQFNLFVELSGINSISFSEYWKAKRSGIKQSELLKNYSLDGSHKHRDFMEKWLKKIEEPKRLREDSLIEGAKAFLLEANKYFQVICITNRQFRNRLLDQMKYLGIEKNFSKILNTSGKTSKHCLVKSNLTININDIFIGDSDEDIRAGKELGLFTIGVTSGGSTRFRLKGYKPNIIIDSVCKKVIYQLVQNDLF
jgi:phosphoglycolate phosphatase